MKVEVLDDLAQMLLSPNWSQKISNLYKHIQLDHRLSYK